MLVCGTVHQKSLQGLLERVAGLHPQRRVGWGRTHDAVLLAELPVGADAAACLGPLACAVCVVFLLFAEYVSLIYVKCAREQ